jgi:alpha-L-glutamate ligase-like protein
VVQLTKWRSFALPSELKQFGILGINARNIDFLLVSHTRSLYPYVDNKVLTKKICNSHHIPVPETYAIIDRFGDISKSLELLENLDDFVIKPAHGAGGHGIIVVISKKDNKFETSKGELLSLPDTRYHISTILSGLYSLGSHPDAAIIEKRIAPHPLFASLTAGGTPDIRIIVYKGVPVMAMLRLPTKVSKGRANLHQGAVGVGVNLKTGQTFGGVRHNRLSDVHPDTGANMSGLVIPQWSNMLTMAMKISDAIGLQYVGVDIVLDSEQGPVVLELNARPGLSIQIANRTGLSPRLKAIDSQAEHMIPIESNGS